MYIALNIPVFEVLGGFWQSVKLARLTQASLQCQPLFQHRKILFFLRSFLASMQTAFFCRLSTCLPDLPRAAE